MSEETELVAFLSAPLPDAKELLAACQEADIPAVLGPDPCCSGGAKSCAPKAQLLVHPEDLPRVQQLVRHRWASLLETEGTVDPNLLATRFPFEPDALDSELPCPACGTAAPLVAGACGDCGLQLE